MHHEANILNSIGNTPLIELGHVVPDGCARILVKLESHNPTGSMKDRMARAIVAGAVARGALAPNGTVVEYTGGSTGTSLAFVCAAMGYHLAIVTSDAFSREKRDHMRALGANVLELPSEGGRTTKELIQRMIAKAREEALFAGTSTGANIAAAIQVAARLGSGHTVATVACDSGLKYLSTDLYTFAKE